MQGRTLKFTLKDKAFIWLLHVLRMQKLYYFIKIIETNWLPPILPGMKTSTS